MDSQKNRICDICGNWARTFDQPELIHHHNCPKYNAEYEQIIVDIQKKNKNTNFDGKELNEAIEYVRYAAINNYRNGIPLGFAILAAILELNDIWE